MPIEGDRLTFAELSGVLGHSSRTLYRWMKIYDDFPARDEHGKFDELEVLAFAGRHAIRASKLVRR